MFRALIPVAIEENIRVAIVTFSGQVDLIRTVLDDIMNSSQNSGNTHKSTESLIPIRGGHPRHWEYSGEGSREGKQAHIASAVEELEHLQGIQIRRETTLLIDDDIRNIRKALQSGTRAVWLNPKKSSRLLKDIVKLV
mmetsp:Transcript_18840/g.27096  ORF Transcript_18840/g.27096 Transcript_18840/m.27096 type:complete len:138 (+) Transcript_18840:196-609(+)